MTPLIGDETDVIDHLGMKIKIGDIVVCAIAYDKSAAMETGMVLSCKETEKQITLHVGMGIFVYNNRTTINGHKYKVSKIDRDAERVTVVTNLIDPSHTIFHMKAYIG